MKSQLPLDYESRPKPSASRGISADQVAAVLGAFNLVWAMATLLAPWRPIDKPIRWALVSINVALIITGLLISLVAARGHRRWVSLLANVVGVGVVGWVMSDLRR